MDMSTILHKKNNMQEYMFIALVDGDLPAAVASTFKGLTDHLSREGYVFTNNDKKVINAQLESPTYMGALHLSELTIRRVLAK